MSGPLKVMYFSAFVKSLYMSAETPVNFSISWSSRTKALTTRMPLRFSCTTLLRPSYVSNTFSKTGCAFRTIR